MKLFSFNIAASIGDEILSKRTVNKTSILLSQEEVTVMLFVQLKEIAESRLGCSISGAVLHFLQHGLLVSHHNL